MTRIESLNTAFRIIGELMNEDCFDFEDVREMNFEERKDYLRTEIWTYFGVGETMLGGIIKRVFNDCKATGNNINEFFKNEELVADTLLFMDEEMYFAYAKEIDILENIQKFMKYIQDMLEVYPEFREMTLNDIDEYLDKKEISYEQYIQKKLNVEKAVENKMSDYEKIKQELISLVRFDGWHPMIWTQEKKDKLIDWLEKK